MTSEHARYIEDNLEAMESGYFDYHEQGKEAARLLARFIFLVTEDHQNMTPAELVNMGWRVRRVLEKKGALP